MQRHKQVILAPTAMLDHVVEQKNSIAVLRLENAYPLLHN